MAYIGVQPRLGNFQACDAITASATTTFNLLVGGTAIFPQSAQHCLVSLNGVLQAPISSYTISGSTIIFAAALTTDDSIDFITILGDTLDLGVPSDDTVTTAKLSNNAVTPAKLGYDYNQYRNIIINGDMSIAQRSTSETGQTSSGYICVDRFRHGINNQGTWTISQDTTVPSGQGFAKSMKMDCTTADASPAAGDYIWFEQKIEGLANLQHLKKGTSNAESVTVSFWVNATKTGTNVLELYDKDNTRHICQTYTINSSNTWEKKTITFDPDTTGTFNFDNGESASLLFWIGAGSNYTSGALDTTWGSVSGRAAHRAGGQVNHADSTSNNFYLTGIQMEAGTTASDFEFLPVDVNLQRCLRYYYVHAEGANKQIGAGGYYTASYITVMLHFPVSMRAAPSLVETTGTDYYRIYRDGAEDAFNNFNVGIQNTTTTNCGMDCNANISGTAGHFGRCTTKNASALIAFNSEL